MIVTEGMPLYTDFSSHNHNHTMQRFISIAVAVAATLMIGDYLIEGVKAGATLATQQVCRSAN